MRAFFTLVHVSAYSNLSSLFGEERRRRPLEDQLIITRGVVGAYPNSFAGESSGYSAVIGADGGN